MKVEIPATFTLMNAISYYSSDMKKHSLFKSACKRSQERQVDIHSQRLPPPQCSPVGALKATYGQS
eukprot:scaffold63917_cov21-Prasinocladus_malaysianus.AAC.1